MKKAFDMFSGPLAALQKFTIAAQLHKFAYN